MAPMPTWIVEPSATRSADERPDTPVGLGGRGRVDLDQGLVAIAPADHLGVVDLVLAERARHVGVGLHEERGPTDQAGGVVGVGAQAEIAVTIEGRDPGQHQRAAGGPSEKGRDLGEGLGTRSTCPAQ